MQRSKLFWPIFLVISQTYVRLKSRVLSKCARSFSDQTFLDRSDPWPRKILDYKLYRRLWTGNYQTIPRPVVL